MFRTIAWLSLGAVLVVGCYRPYEDKPTAKIEGSAEGASPGGSSGSASIGGSTSSTAGSPPTAAGPATQAVATASNDDKYFRPARTGLPVSTSVPRASRSPVRRGEPPPRTRVQAAPSTSGGVLGITFDDLMFPIERDQVFEPSMLTDSVRALLNKKIKIRGFMNSVTVTQDTGIKRFVLMRDDQGCCFGPGAYLYDCIDVRMNTGRSTNFTTRVVAVEGVLSLSEWKDFEGRQLAIFRLDAESAE